MFNYITIRPNATAKGAIGAKRQKGTRLQRMPFDARIDELVNISSLNQHDEYGFYKWLMR